MDRINYKYKDFEEVFIDDISNKALQFTKEATMMSDTYCNKMFEYMSSEVTLLRTDGQYDFINLCDCNDITKTVSTIVENTFEKSKPLAFMIMTDFVNNEFYCTNEDITNKLNGEILLDYMNEVELPDISQIIMNICWKYKKSLKNN